MIDHLPKNWRMVKLGACLQRRKETLMPATLSESTIGLVGLEDIQDGGRGGISICPTNPRDIQSLKTCFEPGDILYGKLRPYLNKVGIAPESGVCSTEIWAFVPRSFVNDRFATFFLASSFFVDRIASLTKGANLPRLDTDSFDSIEIPLPPLSEQQQIVGILHEAEEIRSLRTEAETKTAELIPAIFESVFGNPVANPKKWKTEPLAALINDTPKNGLYKPADLYGEGTPIIRIGDFTGGILRNTNILQRLRISDQETEQFGVSNGQILINRVNSIEHLGKSLLVASLTEPTVYESNMIRLDPKTEKVLPEFLIACLQHGSVVAKLRAKAKKAINQASINQTDVTTLVIPVPPLEKQEAFLSLVSQSEDIRILAESSLRLEKVLNESLSAHAFSGHLTDEWRESHASILAAEAQDRDNALKQAGATISRSRRATIQEVEQIFEQQDEDLNREQLYLLREIKRQVAGVDYGRYLTAEQIAAKIEGPLYQNPQAIEAHLRLFSARGLLVSLSRPRSDANPEEFAACYRLPINAKTSDVENYQVSDDIRGDLMANERQAISSRGK